ncbi:lysine transporter LysE [Kitasatospora sp. NPDC058170]|uniref:lysine transporter LysE n=1 Tax=Kitasatospora sp. NPDC058170 TaxID=3346364 RepID=UPI0036D968BF
MESLVGATASGVLAGLGVAVPLGAVGVLLLEEGRRGWRSAASAASAVALVDMVYAGLATAFGARLAQALAGWEVWARAGSAVVLGVVAVRGLLGLRRPVAFAGGGGGAGAVGVGGAVGEGGVTGAAGEGGAGTAAREGGVAGSFLRFAGLTLVNPATVLYFAALVTGGGGPAGWAGGAAFVLGVLVASLTWQQLLAAVGVSVGARLSPRARRLTYCAGYGLIVYYAVRMAWPR